METNVAAAEPPPTQAITPITATAIPEVTSIIASYLTKKDLSSCTLVCRTWCIAYTPLIWKTLNTRIPTPKNASLLPGLLAKNGRYIRSLTITDLPETYTDNPNPSTELVFDCPAVQNIVHLTINTEREKKQAMKNIIYHSRHTLRFLRLNFKMDKSKKPAGWRGEPWLGFPDMVPYLHSIFLDNWNMTRQELIALLKACPNLKVLSFSSTFLDQEPPPTSTTAKDQESLSDDSDGSLDRPETKDTFQHFGIRNFRMCSKLYHVLDLMPNIEILEFYRFDRSIEGQELERFCQTIKEHCKRLNQIWAFGFECSMLPPVLESLSQLVAYRGCSDIETELSILDHANSLEEANLSDYTERNFLPLKFMESCPRLRSFITGHSSTTMNEVQGSLRRGWACQNLQELRLFIFKLSPALIEAIMQDLGAERETDSRTRTRRSAVWIASQLEQRQQMQAAMNALTREQRDFQDEFSRFLRGFRKLTRLNFGTGWYSISRSKVVSSSTVSATADPSALGVVKV
ncbi:hypothetical protein BGZ80_000836 [Entomortierella chlamydospora]|uniref:F-box domain-containing protein n=1 Tax=Entomortierella chlamydospora TaxID=101097 RepID=A0A9P6SY67_9FUNG|nr:hypothetical protein BGZ79_000707 [Entomortierella chlamydospora]KAG0011231.1 hypothetical protein BGZ80_000836 [Entomortierella chlamydospora]